MYCHFSVSSCQSFHCPTLWQRALVFHYKLNLTTLSFVVYNRSGENSLYLTDRELPPPKQLCTRMYRVVIGFVVVVVSFVVVDFVVVVVVDFVVVVGFVVVDFVAVVVGFVVVIVVLGLVVIVLVVVVLAK